MHLSQWLVLKEPVQMRVQIFKGFYTQQTVQAIRNVIEPEFEEIFRADPRATRTKLGAPVEVCRLH